jgi:PTS system mannose-specific IIB component
VKEKIILRVDDRGPHSQVLIGWVFRLGIKRVVVCKEGKGSISAPNHFLPGGFSLSFLSPQEILKNKSKLSEGKGKVLIISYSLNSAYQLIKGGLGVKELNIGGLHYRKGKKRLLDFVHFGKRDILILEKIISLGVRIFAQENLDGPRYNLKPPLRIDI